MENAIATLAKQLRMKVKDTVGQSSAHHLLRCSTIGMYTEHDEKSVCKRVCIHLVPQELFVEMDNIECQDLRGLRNSRPL